MSSTGQDNLDKTQNYFDAAVRGADWLAGNQVRDFEDANKGRFIREYYVNTGEVRLSDDWTTGAAIMSVLAAWRRTGEQKYLDSAVLAGEYLKSIQILDQRNPRYFGAFRERNPQTSWCYTRDALTSSWALLWLYEATGDQEYLYRVQIFNHWFMGEAYTGDWPRWEVNFRGDTYRSATLWGSFHGGDGAYFYDYARITADWSYLEKGLVQLADQLIAIFQRDDGGWKIIYDHEKQEYLDDKDDPAYPLGWQIMHRYNDDFSSVTLLSAYLHTGSEKYLTAAKRFADWLISEQQENGGYGEKPVPPASATCAMSMLDLHKITGEEKYLESALKAGSHLLMLQEIKSEDHMAFGGFYGYNRHEWDTRECINLRTHAYAVIALLKLEGQLPGPYYSASDRDGELKK